MRDFKNKEKRKLDISTLIYGKIPPQARSLEEQVIGILILFPDNMLEVASVLKADDFYVNQHQIIFKHMVDLMNRARKIDAFLLMESFKASGEVDIVGGLFYLAKCTDSVRNDTVLMDYARLIKQYSLARKLIIFSSEVLNKAYDDDFFETLDFANEQLFKIYEDLQTQQEKELTAIGVEAINKTTVEHSEDSYVYTGIDSWDRINGTLLPTLYTIAARPGMGKTAFAIELICKAAKTTPIGFINGEMSDVQVTRRLVSNLVDFNNAMYKRPVKEWEEHHKDHFHKGIQEFVNLKLHIFSDSTDLDTVCNKLRYWKRKLKIKFAIIDYVQLLRINSDAGKYMSTTEKLNEIMDQLRMLAKAEDLPIIILSQLNREVHKRAGTKRPNLSDLKGSGAIEESSFQVAFLHRPEVYGEVIEEFGETTKGLCFMFIEKHRDGELADLKFRFVPQFSRFDDWEDEYSVQNFNPMNKDINDSFGSWPKPDNPNHKLDDFDGF
jgi:replicative DNA helicase